MRAELPPCFDGLKAAAREVGSIQIQNAGTLAGNLCNASPAADGMPPLLCLGAEMELASRRGVRRLAVAEFVTGERRTAGAADELVSAVFVPDLAAGTVPGFHKLGARRYLVISIAMVAASLRVEAGRILDARVAVGACSPVARRLTVLEARLLGLSVAADLSMDVTDLVGLEPISDFRFPMCAGRGSIGWRRWWRWCFGCFAIWCSKGFGRMADVRASLDVGFVLNGSAVSVAAEPGERLYYALRERLGAREVKIGCNAGDCGACSVLVEGDVVCACLMSAHQAAGKRVETVRGLLDGAQGRALVASFQDH